MKKLYLLYATLVLFGLISATSASAALVFELSNYNVSIPKGGYAEVTLTARDNGEPVPGVPLEISEVCRVVGQYQPFCDEDDVYWPDEVDVDVTTPTNENGQATVSMEHDGSEQMGKYHYTVCEAGDENNCKGGSASVTGDLNVPEFTAIGAGLALLGASTIYMIKRRKR